MAGTRSRTRQASVTQNTQKKKKQPNRHQPQQQVQDTQQIQETEQAQAEQQLLQQKAVLATKTVNVTYHQSLELVQTVLHASISVLAYRRRWFDDGCFAEQVYQPGETHWPYKEYAAGKSEPPPPSEDSTGRTKLFVLQRGKSSRVNQLLDWLEFGVLDALKHGYLKDLQLCLFENENCESDILESYNFAVDYTKGSSGEMVPSMKTPTGRGVPIRNVKWSLQNFVREVQLSALYKSELPYQCYLKMILSYTDDRPDGYTPPYFTNVEDTSGTSSANKKDMETIEIAEKLRSGYHSVVFCVTRPKENNDDIPNRASTEDVSMAETVEVSDSQAAPSIPSNERSVDEPRASTAPDISHDINANEYDATEGQAASSLPHRTNKLEPNVQSSRSSSIVEADNIHTRDMIHNMQQSIDLPDDTQVVEHSAQAVTAPAQLSQTTIAHLQSSRCVRSIARRTSNIVKCDCGFQKEGGQMTIQCDFCKTWQHSICYGYQGTDQKAMPDMHACYSCLLGGQRDDILETMRKLAVHRRGVHIIDKYGYVSDHELRKKIQCTDTATVYQLIIELRKENLLIETKSGTRQALSNEPAAVQRLRELYFDPTTNIAQYFELPATPTAMPTQVQDHDNADNRAQPTSDRATVSAVAAQVRTLERKRAHERDDDMRPAKKEKAATVSVPIGEGAQTPYIKR